MLIYKIELNLYKVIVFNRVFLFWTKFKHILLTLVSRLFTLLIKLTNRFIEILYSFIVIDIWELFSIRDWHIS